MLPKLPYRDNIKKTTQSKFGGYDHRRAAQDGGIWDMTNMASDEAPLLCPRKRRYIIAELETPNGIYGGDGLFWVDGTTLYHDGEETALTLEDSKKIFAEVAGYIVIWPDRKWYRRDGTCGSMQAAVTAQATIGDGTYAGEPAEGNTITAIVAWADYFRVGDAVTITTPTQEMTIIIREIDGNALRFYENSFEAEEGEVTVARTVPELDFIFSDSNRLWGCKGDTIYASKPGDPFNFNVFDGIATDSWQAAVGSAGDFTGAASYLGYPTFFKENQIYKVYGDRPSNYKCLPLASVGVEAGAGGSLAEAGGTLFYLSRVGVTAYGGGTPRDISAIFGEERYKNAVAGGNGKKYFISMQGTDGWSLFVYDTGNGAWSREDDTQAVGFAFDEELYCLNADGTLWLDGAARSAPEGAELEEFVQSNVIFNDFTEGSPDKKGTAKLQLRLELEEDASVSVYLRLDDEPWETVKTLTTETKRSYYLPIIPRRADHMRVKIEGTGMWRLYSLTREYYGGSEA